MAFSKFNDKRIWLVVIILIFLILASGFVYKYKKTILYILRYKNIQLSCPGIIDTSVPRKTEIILAIDLKVNGSTAKPEINKILYIFINRFKNDMNLHIYKYSKLQFKSQDWIRLYFKKQDYSQIKYLYRALNINKYNSCDLLQELIYLTGITPDRIFYTISYNSDNKNYRGLNLSLTDLIRIMKLKDISINQSTALRVEELKPPLTKVLLEDGSYVYAYSFSNIFPLIKKFVSSSIVKEEGVSVEIYNATNKTGYATFWATVFKGIGFKVTRVGTAYKRPRISEGSKRYWVYVTNQASTSRSFRYIQSILGKDNIYLAPSRPDDLVTTGDIVIILLK